jgi:serine phosphatase RsbU (regulator of sigma subunit)/tetratricopeptide (TPR) repeat protein/transposase
MIDQGHTFDPRTVRDPDLQRYVDIGKKGGLGIFIIRRVIDDIDYRKTADGNELRLTKKREVHSRKRFLPELSITMKTRFSLIASGVFTIITVTAFIWIYFQREGKVLQENLDRGWELARSMSSSSVGHLEDKEMNPVETMSIARDTRKGHEDIVVETIVIDTTGRIMGSSQPEGRMLEMLIIPSNAVRISENIYQYKHRMLGLDPMDVYDLAKRVIPKGRDVNKPIGTVHILLNKNNIDAKVASEKKEIFGIFGIVLALGYIGVFALIYVTMSPFKKLAAWVRDLGHEEARDEIEFDSSDEIGEIAKAFNDITEKFRKSQVNLAEQERLQKEMQVAQEIQHTLLPAAFPEIDGYEIASYYEAAKEVGGDYFDFVEVDKDTLGIVVADVSGKGVPGSLVMTMIRTALRTEARGNKNAADVLAKVNDFVINDMKRGMFVTVFYIILDSHKRTINYASAGHNPMILYRANTQKSYYLNPRGFPIGINLPDNSLFRKSIQSDKLQLREGDVLICYTDGITEAMNPQRDRFGDERLLSVIRQYGAQKVDPLVDEIRNEIITFTEGFAQNDDVTLVAIKEKLRAEDVLFNLRTRLMTMVKEEGVSVKEACKSVGVSTTTYYKYKKRYKKMGIEGLKEKRIRSEIEEKHISIEDRAKIYDIIKNYPEYGAKRISEELKTDKYSDTKIAERRIYDELVRGHLNTKNLRLAFIENGEKGRRLKPPGTPLLTLDGKVIIEHSTQEWRADTLGEKGAGDFDERKKPFEIRVSQLPKEEVFASDKYDEDQDTILEDFLGISEISKDKTEDSEVGDEEMTELFPGDLQEELGPEEKTGEFDELELVEEDKSKDVLFDAEQQEEATLGDLTEDTVLDEETESLLGELEEELFDQIFTETVEGMDKEEQNGEESEKPLNLQKILETDEEKFSGIVLEDQIEDRISASIAGELFNEEMGIGEESEEIRESTGQKEEGFLEMMEGLGFDRRTVLSDSRKAKEEAGQSNTTKELNKKRYLEAGLWFYRQGHYSKAIGEFQKAMKEDPEFTEAYQYLGDTCFRMGKLDKAREAYEMVRKLDPDNVDVLENLGVIFANRGDYKKAVWQWGEVLKRNPDRRDIINRIKKMQRVIRQRYL